MSYDNAKKTKKRYIYRDNIQGIKKNQIRRLAYVAGIEELSSLCYEEVRGIIKQKLENIISNIYLYLDYSRTRTMTDYMVASIISPHMWSEKISGKKCKPKSKSRSKKDKNKMIQENIKYYQDNSTSCLTFEKSSFKKLLKEIMQDFTTLSIRFPDSSCILLQYFIEDYVVHILKSAKNITVHSKRKTVEPKDINLAKKLSE